MSNFQTVGLIAPRAEQKEQKEPKKDPLDQILKGLQIANGVMGIGVNYTEFQKNRGDLAAQEDTRNGVLTKGQELGLMEKGLDKAQPDADGNFPAGAVQYKTRQGEDTPTAAFVRSQKPEKPLMGWVTTRDAKGVEESVYSPLTEGMRAVKQPVPLRASPKASGGGSGSGSGGSGGGSGKLVQVDTVDAQGNPAKTFVRPEEGKVVPTGKPADKAADKSRKESDYRYNNLQKNAAKLKELVQKHGTMELTGAAGDQMDSLVYDMAVDYAKLVDPESIAREGEVAAAQKYMLGFRKFGGATTTNQTALEQIDNYAANLDSRLGSLAEATGQELPASYGKRGAPPEGLAGQPPGNDPLILQYMKAHNLQYGQAEAILTQRGYKPGG